MSADAYWFLIDWAEALKRNTPPNDLWKDIWDAMEARDEALDAEDWDDEGDSEDAAQEDEGIEEVEESVPAATWFRELDSPWGYNAYLWSAFAYEEGIRDFIPEAVRKAADAFMLPNITSLGGYHQDLGNGDIFLVSLSPESVRNYLKLAGAIDLSQFSSAYYERCPENTKEQLALYAGDGNVETSFETGFKPFVDSYIGHLRAADAAGRGFILAVNA